MKKLFIIIIFLLCPLSVQAYENLTVYDIDGREDTARDILEQQLNIHISKAWHEIFEKNLYRDLGIVL